MFDYINNLRHHSFFDTYLRLVQFEEAKAELMDSQHHVDAVLDSLDNDQLSIRYQPDKWSVAQLFLHFIETEQVFNYRALTIAKSSENHTLMGFDENEYAERGDYLNYEVEDIRRYFNAVRNTTILLLKGLSEQQLSQVGVASGHEIEVKALFYINSGHCRHHLNVLNERYLNR